MEWIAAESGVAYGDSPAATKAHRILADHGRGMTFLVADGVMPSNEGRGYVLRRIIRRAVVQAQRIGLDDLLRAAVVVVEQMGDAYPELATRDDEIERAIWAEEERFWRRSPAASSASRSLPVSRDLGGRRVHARGDLRLPDRAHRRACRGARSAGRRRRLRGADGGAPRDLARVRRRRWPSARSTGPRRTSSATRRPRC